MKAAFNQVADRKVVLPGSDFSNMKIAVIFHERRVNAA
jgi:hypothetical protein